MSLRQQVWLIVLVVVTAAMLLNQGWQVASRTWTVDVTGAMMQAMAYYGSWLMPVLTLVVLYCRRQRQMSLPAVVFSLTLLVLGMYARFVEPNMLLVKYTTIHTGYSLRLALISDMHYGLHSTSGQMQRLVDRLNELDVDAVVVAGDWTNEPPRDVSLTQLLKPFSQVRHPVYSVPGNHDEEFPGPPLQQALKAALLANRVQPIEEKSIDLGKVRLLGLNDLWSLRIEHMPEVEQAAAVLPRDNKPLLILTHNPDSLHLLPEITQPYVLLAGHTHGGQVNLPVLTRKLLEQVTDGHYQRGLYQRGHNQVFITSGIGMVGLPLRFAMPPTIDVLQFN